MKKDLTTLIGQKYNKLTILNAVYEQRGNDKRKQIYVTAQCDCGTIKDYALNNIVYGTTKSCGCKNKINLDALIGQQFNYLKVLSAERRRNGHTTCTYATCECICGAIKEYQFSQVKSGKIKSCGCINQVDLSSLIGQQFGQLVILSAERKRKGNEKNNRIYCICKCTACGNITEVAYGSLQIGHTTTCGCLKKMLYSDTDKCLYKILSGMKTRCYAKKARNYKNYGSRGISICTEWLENFYAFKEWALNNGYQKGLSIDRINNNGNYCPENCRWTDMKTQNNNKRTNRYIEINGETKTLTQWCERYQINYDAVWDRIKKHNWDPLKALTTPVRNKKSSSKTTTNKLISNQTILNESSNLTNN